MIRSVACVLAVLVYVNGLSAQESLKDEQLQRIKAATVFVKVGMSGRGATGSGFLVKVVDGKTGYIVTNNHVVDLSDGSATDEELQRAPVQVVFDSGAPTEQVIRATIVAADADRDLAVLKIQAKKDLPKPLEITDPPKLRETMPVFICGFPFGGRLAEGNKNPEISIGNATISSIRSEVAGGPVSRVQIAGALNSGNSGGPIVASDGKLVGVAVTTIRGAGIGFAIPQHEVESMMKGRAGEVAISLLNPDNMAMPDSMAKLNVRIIDPLQTVKSVSAHVLPGAKDVPKLMMPPGPIPNATKVDLKIDGWQATGNVTIPGEAKKGLIVQLELELESGKLFTNAILVTPGNGRPGLGGNSASRRGIQMMPDGNLKLANGSIIPRPQVPPTLPNTSDAVNVSILNASPEQHVGKSVQMDALSSCSVNFADRGEFELSVETDTENAPSQVRVVLPKDLALQIAALGIPEITQGGTVLLLKFPIRITGTVAKPMGREKRHTLTATQLVFLNSDSKTVSTYKPETASKSEKPTLDDINRFPEKYLGQTHIVEGWVIGTRSSDGVGLDIANENRAQLLNLDAYTSKGLAAQVESDLPKTGFDRGARAKLTLEVKAIHGRTNKGVVGISQLDILSEEESNSKVLKSTTGVDYPKIPAPLKPAPTPEVTKTVEKKDPVAPATPKSADNTVLILATVAGVAGLLGGGLILYFALRKPKVQDEDPVEDDTPPKKRSYQRAQQPEPPAKKSTPSVAKPSQAKRATPKPPPPADDNPFAGMG